MNTRTASAFAVLEKADWFSRVGVRESSVAEVLSSWQEAMKYCDSPDGENFGLAAMNQFGHHLCIKNEPRHEQWNSVVHDLESAVRTLVNRKIETVVRDQNLSRDALDSMIYGGILLACVELEYADVFSPGFFASLIFWYVKGHFPCGWKGVVYAKPKMVNGLRQDAVDLYPPGFYDKIAHWYEKGDFGDWQGQIPQGKLIVY